MKTRTLLLLPFLLGSFYPGFSQADLKKQFPESDAVYTNLSCEVTIRREEGKLIAVREFSEDLVYLTDNAVKMMRRGAIYHSSFNELKKWDAYTQLPQERKKLKISNTATASSRQDYIFYDDVKSTSFDYTGGMVGATRHLEYQLQNHDVYLLTPFYFERYFPVAEGELRITIPADVKLKFIKKGLNADRILLSVSQKKDKTTYTFRITNLDGVRSYADAPDNSWYATHLIFYIEQVKENGTWKNFLAGPDDLYKHSYAYISTINKKMSPELLSITDSLVKNNTDHMEKARKIYRWVQSNIKYVAFEDGMEGFVPREANLVCNRRFGDCKDMASILTAMLNHAGVTAYFTWIGTRDIPYDYTEVPLPIVDNHMICAVKNGNDFIFLDATDEGCFFGMPSSGIQDKQAMIAIDPEQYRIVRVPVMDKKRNTWSDSTFMKLGDKGITGNIKVEMKGYFASGMHSVLNFRHGDEREEYFRKRFERSNNKIKFSNWTVQENTGQESVVIRADFELADYAKKQGDEFFINMNPFKWYEHGEIDFPKRKIPIAFPFLNQTSYVTVVTIPAGYTAHYIPKSNSFDNGIWGYQLKYATTRDKVYLTQEFDTNQLLLFPSQFEGWNKVLEHLFPNYKQTVSFQKN